jgi:hypothetical protein
MNVGNPRPLTITMTGDDNLNHPSKWWWLGDGLWLDFTQYYKLILTIGIWLITCTLSKLWSMIHYQVTSTINDPLDCAVSSDHYRYNFDHWIIKHNDIQWWLFTMAIVRVYWFDEAFWLKLWLGVVSYISYYW